MTFKLSFRNLSLFVFIWVNVGFALGFIVLMGPVRWIANYSRENRFSESRENLMIKALILLFVAVSFVISMLLTTGVIRAKSKNNRVLVPLGCLVLGALALYQLLNPRILHTFSKQEKDTENKQFIFGPYPTKEALDNYKKEGITTVISLLHPAITPFEPVLLKEEAEICKKAGLALISIPMMPWISDNEEALKKIKQLAQHPEGKYYVHCYLGKDRVNVAKRLITAYSASENVAFRENKRRSLDSISAFERGQITKIATNVYFTPYPTDEEYAGYVIGGGVQQVVSLMDPKDPEQKSRIEAEKTVLDTYGIPFKNIIIRPGNNNQELARLKEFISTLPKPLVVHRFFTNTPEDLALIEALKK